MKRCDAYYEQKDYRKCVETLTKVLEVDHQHVIAKFKLGRCHFNLNECKRTVKAFKGFLKQAQAETSESTAGKSHQIVDSFFVTSVGLSVSLPKPKQAIGFAEDS